MYKLYVEKGITSEKLLKKVLSDYMGIKEYALKYNEYGKPYLENSNIFFNISHCRDICVIAVGDKPLGVDIEFYTYKDNLHHTFNDLEKNILMSSNDKEKIFTKMWVIKEAYSKLIGTGLSYGLDKIDSLAIEKDAHLIYERDYVICVIEDGCDEVLI